MTTTDQDIRALAYLAGRLREDTYGANHWDAAGIMAELKPLVGQNLAITIERVTRHAADSDAKTPGAIRRPFVPGPPEPRRERNVAPLGSRCTTCDARTPDACTPDHDFTPPHDRTVDITGTVAELKGLARATERAAAQESEAS